MCCIRVPQEKPASATFSVVVYPEFLRSVGGASGGGAAGLLDALGPGVQQLGQGVLVGQLQQLGRHGSVDLQQEAVGSCWGGQICMSQEDLLTSQWLGAALTILVSVGGPVGALLGVVGRNPQLQRRNAREVLVV